MISNEKIMLLGIWRKDPFAELSISEIMKFSGKKTKTWVFNALKDFKKKMVLLSKRKGNLDLYSLNLENPVSFQLLQYLEVQENISFAQMSFISEIIKKIPVKNYCLAVFGSYAEGKEKKRSDIDLCFFVENGEMEKKMRPYFNEVKLNYPIKADEHFVMFDEFIQMLLRHEENLGKQIFRKHRIIYNADIYYQLVKEAYKNGFRP